MRSHRLRERRAGRPRHYHWYRWFRRVTTRARWFVHDMSVAGRVWYLPLMAWAWEDWKTEMRRGRAHRSAHEAD